MSRRKKGDPVHGWVILDKPPGMTSTQAVAQVRRIFDAQKAGHAGTLDPLATGILAIALGEATKTVPYVQDAAKIYRFTATWGESRDSDDAEGKVTGTSDVRPSREADRGDAAPLHRRSDPDPAGLFRHQGRRASGPMTWPGRAKRSPWNPARSRSMRPGWSSAEPDQAEFEILCGKGTYVRSWVRDLALALGTLGHVSPAPADPHWLLPGKRRDRTGNTDPFYA